MGAMTRTGRKEEVLSQGELLGNSLLADDGEFHLETPKLREKVDSIVDQWLTDLWLLLSGEELNGLTFETQKDGRAFAMVCDGQMRLLESRFAAINRLRSVGLDMA